MIEAEFGILYFLQSIHTPWLDVVMKNITHLGDSGIFWILTGLVLFCFKKTRKMGFCVLLSLAGGLLIGNILLKNLVARDRPCWIDPTVQLLIENPGDFSFPSGHTMASFEAAVSIFLYNRRWGAAALVLAALIAFSRLYLFVHFPSDVLTGLVLGVVIALAVHKGVEWMVRQKKEKNADTK